MPRRQAFFVNYGTTNRNFHYICPQKPKKISQKVINQVIPETQKALDEGLAEIRKMMKEHPELAAQLKDQLKEAEAQRGKLTAEHVKEVGDYTYQPADILKALTAIAIKHDFKSPNPTTRWSDIIKLK